MRCIQFKIPSSRSGSGVSVTLSEQPDGTITMELVTYGDNVDFRGLFFDTADPSILGALAITGSNVANTSIANDAVSNLGNGINMNGSNGGTFDAGVSFGKSGATASTLTLSSSDGPLTLDMFAHVDFGIRFGSGGGKTTVQAPAAPNAFDDTTSSLEDVATTFGLLTNDTDADAGDVLTITSATDPPHGTVSIAADGHTLVYTADPNFSGTDTFTYQISDGNGGKDTATVTVNVVAVADAPDASVAVAAGSTVNQIRLLVSSAVTDTDGSEFIDRIEFTGLPPGATIVEAPGGVYDDPGNPGALVREFTLVLQPGQSFDFDLGIRTIAREVSNGSEAVTTETIAIELDAASATQSGTFSALDQSIWSTGAEFVFDDHRFFGINESITPSAEFAVLRAELEATLKAGLQSDLHFEGGDIDASLPYDITIDSSYNRTTDVLLLDSNALLTGGSFNTQGPIGSYQLDFIFEYLLQANLIFDAGIFGEYTLFSEGVSGDYSRNLIDIDQNSSTTIGLPFGIDATIAWPNVSTVSGPGLTSTGASNEFLHLNLDVDQALADIFFGGANPFDVDFDISVAEGTIEFLDLDLFGGLDFVQNFELTAAKVVGSYVFENGAVMAFDTTTNLQIDNASSYDADGDGVVEFNIQLTPEAQLRNMTELGINLGYNFDLLKFNGTYDVGVKSGSFNGTLIDLGGEFQVADITLYDQAFGLNFNSQTFGFAL